MAFLKSALQINYVDGSFTFNPIEMLSLNYKLVLGSKSPRRVELLQKCGLNFEQRVIETDESYPSNLEVSAIAQYIAEAKAAAHSSTIQENELVLTADTIVVHNGLVYGKPASEQEAFETLRILSGSQHQVYTGVCFYTIDKFHAFSEMSEVNFSELTANEILWYIKEFQPFDKAGSYGIQDWIGNVKINSIVGSYTNILGLPLGQVYTALEKFGQ